MSEQPCSDGPIRSTGSVVLENTPFVAMLLLGAAIMRLSLSSTRLAWVAAAAYLFWGVLGALGIMLLVCPHCPLFATHACPCGYGIIAAKLRSRGDPAAFARMFRLGILPIVPLWFLPPAVAAFAIYRSGSIALSVLLGLFLIDAFVILPVLSKTHGCRQCPQQQSCPWMAR